MRTLLRGKGADAALPRQRAGETGPALCFALAGLAYLLLILSEVAGISEPLQAVLEYLAFINIVLALFNLLPAFPLDGGRVLRAALWYWSGAERTLPACKLPDKK